MKFKTEKLIFQKTPIKEILINSKKFSNKYTNDKKVKNNFIDGEYEDRDENNK